MTNEEKMETVKQFKSLIKSIAGKYSRGSGIFEDLCIVGEVACLKALDTFDKTKKTKLSTYLYGRIEGAIKDEIKTKYNFFGRKSKEKPIPISDIEEELSYEIESLLDTKSDNESIKKIIEGFSEREKKIIYLRYWEELTFSEISKEEGINETKLYQVHKDILSKIKEKLRK